MSQTHPSCEDRIDESWNTIRSDLFDIISKDDTQTLDDYILGLDYVRHNDEPYWRLQFSTGGPQEEIRFFDPHPDIIRHFSGYNRAEFWFLDWFDSASIDVTDDEVVQVLWDELAEMGRVDPDKTREER